MELYGFPKTFWFVVSPSPVSTLADICFESDSKRFAVQIRGGLDVENIVGVFAEHQPAEAKVKQIASGERWYSESTGREYSPVAVA